MRPNIHTRTLRRLAVILVATVPLLVATAAPAWASPPPNDDISNATVITSLPFHDTLDMSQATFDPTDVSSCDGSAHSVWYSFTPASNEQVALDPSASPGTTAVDVFTGSPGVLSSVGCGVGGGFFGTGGFILNATGGTTYWIMASTCCFDPVPTLNLWVYLAVPPQATLSVTGGTVDRAGNATITGTLDCVGTVPAAGVTGSVSQPVGRRNSVSGSFATTVTTCARAQPWAALAQPTAGKFAGGPATVNVTSLVCNLVGCSIPAPTSTTAVIKLRG